MGKLGLILAPAIRLQATFEPHPLTLKKVYGDSPGWELLSPPHCQQPGTPFTLPNLQKWLSSLAIPLLSISRR